MCVSSGRDKKVLQVHFWGDVNSPLKGSVENIVMSLALAMKSYAPLIASLGEKNAKSVKDCITFYTFKEDRVKRRIFNKFFNLKVNTFSSLSEIINKERPQILHIHNRPVLVDKIIARLDYIPKVVCQYHRHFNEIIIPRHCDLILAVSNSVKEHIYRLTKTDRDIDVLHNPVPGGVLKVGDGLPSNRNPLPVMFYPGGNQEHKGFRELLKSVDMLNNEKVRFKLLLAGPKLGGYRPPFENVENLNYLAADRLYEKLAHSDILVLPTYNEGFSLAILEAMYLKKLVVSTYVGGNKDCLTTSNSILVRAEDPTSLYYGLKEAIGLMGQGSKTKQERAFETATGFLPAIIASRLETIYDRLLGLSDTR
ncbi:MAG TPA: glycosyltransferase family 4 protein [Thermodesulfovibrionales bacterium]|nr:glycosyltransferase family 4 protein [Thermodesulfovibrionales bacterium]